MVFVDVVNMFGFCVVLALKRSSKIGLFVLNEDEVVLLINVVECRKVELDVGVVGDFLLLVS